jgi:hypothetical protein
VRTTRAFIATTLLALTLVVAMIVPAALIPGSFGFKDWPTATSGGDERSVQVDAESPATVERQQHRARPTGVRVRPAARVDPAATRPARRVESPPGPGRQPHRPGSSGAGDDGDARPEPEVPAPAPVQPSAPIADSPQVAVEPDESGMARNVAPPPEPDPFPAEDDGDEPPPSFRQSAG